MKTEQFEYESEGMQNNDLAMLSEPQIAKVKELVSK